MSIGDFLKKLFTRPVKAPAGPEPVAGVGGGNSKDYEGDYSDDAWIAGRSLPQLAEVRGALWKYGSEARAAATLEMKPEFWPDGRMRFDHEFSMANNTQVLRHGLLIQISDRVRQHGQKLGDLSQRIAAALQDLKDADAEAANTIRQWRKIYDDVQRDESEFNKYSRLKSKYGLFMSKWVLLPIFIFAETALTIIVFKSFMGGEHATTMDKLVAFCISTGVVVGLVAIPHYTAVALKEGLTRRHKFELEAYRRFGLEPTDHLLRKDHIEKVEDKGAWIIAACMIAVLGLLIWPLAHLRAIEFNSTPVEEATTKMVKAQVAVDGATDDLAQAQSDLKAAQATGDQGDDSFAQRQIASAKSDLRDAKGTELAAKAELNRVEEANKGNNWLWFFMLFQVVISAFFFLIEWVNHGETARHLKDLDVEKKKAIADRSRRQKALVTLVADFDYEAQAQAHVIRSAPHYDQELVSNYYKEIREFREIIRREQPDLHEFLHFAPHPQLPVDPDAEVDPDNEFGYTPIPIALSNPSLEANDHYDVRYPIRRAVASITERQLSEVVDNDGDTTMSDEWLMISNPYSQLYQALARWGFEEPFYKRPSELDDVLDIESNPLDEVFKANSERVLDEIRKNGVPEPEPELDPEDSADSVEGDPRESGGEDEPAGPSLRGL